MIQNITNNYGNFFRNGTYANGKPILYKFCFYHVANGDDFGVFQQEGSDTYCVGHNVNLDFEAFTCSWCWGHYDFKTFEDAKNFCLHYFDERVKS